MDMKNCGRCRETKTVDNFSKDRARTDGLRNNCKYCDSIYHNSASRKQYMQEYYQRRKQEEPEKLEEENRRKQEKRRHDPYTRRKEHDYRLRYDYNLTLETYEKILEEQNYVCEICGKTDPNYNLHVDHNHQCCPYDRSCGNCIRGLICGNCNKALGLIGENIDSLQQIIQYLELRP